MVQLLLQIGSWWLGIQLLGFVALPLTFFVYRQLPDRGYAFSKPLGLLAVGFVFWLEISLLGGANNLAGLMVTLALTTGLAWGLMWFGTGKAGRKFSMLGTFVQSNWKPLLIAELLFLVTFAGSAVLTACRPQISAGEKPFEYAFLNSVLRSSRFPPVDPWFSGHAIPYYYLGYVLVAVMTRLTGTPSEVGFNLGVALSFALAAVAAFGVIHNLIEGTRRRFPARYATGPSAIMWGLLGVVLVVVCGNLEGLLEFLHAWGAGGAGFWQWLDIQGLRQPSPVFTWWPAGRGWWGRAGRVIFDRDVLDRSTTAISDFPFHALLAGNLHPHFMAMPIVLLALGLALALIQPRKGVKPTGVAAHLLALALIIGGLGAIHTWDLPTYLALAIAAFGLGRRLASERGAVAKTTAFAVAALVGCIVLYLPFYVNLQAAAVKPLPNLLTGTRPVHFLIILGLFVFIVTSFVMVHAVELVQRKGSDLAYRLLRSWGSVMAVAVVVPLLLALLAGGVVTISPQGRTLLAWLSSKPSVHRFLGEQQDLLASLLQALAWRGRTVWAGVFLLGFGMFVAVLLLHSLRPDPQGGSDARRDNDPSVIFTLLCVAAGSFVVLLPEVMFLYDLRSSRANTVSKFYYQGWVLWSVAAAFGLFYFAQDLRSRWRFGNNLWWVGSGLLLTASLLYPIAGSLSKAGTIGAYSVGTGSAVHVQAGLPSLDGLSWLRDYQPDDYTAILWLREHVAGSPVLLEAPSKSEYDYAGRVSAMTGIPTVLGWRTHEHHWRGSEDEIRQRERDITELYNATDGERARALLEQYGIEYVYVGPLERMRYDDAGLAKFAHLMDVVLSTGQVTVYRRGSEKSE